MSTKTIHPEEALIGALFVKYRNLANLNQTSFAAFVPCTYQQVQKYETGESRFKVSNMIEYCSLLGVNPLTFVMRVITQTEPTLDDFMKAPLSPGKNSDKAVFEKALLDNANKVVPDKAILSNAKKAISAAVKDL